MDETLDVLGDRLHPRHMVDQLMDLFRGGGDSRSTETLRHTGEWAWQKARHHPVPLALMGAGLVWMMCEDDKPSLPRRGHGAPEMYGGSYVDARTGRPYDASYGEEWRGREPGAMDKAKGKMSDAAGKAGSALRRAGDKTSGAASSARDTASHAADSVRGAAANAADQAGEWNEKAWDSMHRAGDQMRSAGHRMRHNASAWSNRIEEGYDRSRETVAEAVDDYPLAACAATVGLGMLVGFLVPHSRREDRWMGEESDEMKHRARETGEEMMERGQEVASATAVAATDEAKRQGLTPGQLSEKGKHVAEDIGGAAQESAKDEGLTPSALKEKAKSITKEAKETAKEETRHQKDEAKHKHGG